MAGLKLPQGTGGHRSGTGREYPQATRPEITAPIKRPTIHYSGVGQLINDCQLKMKAFSDRHETVPQSFKDELKQLLDSLREAPEDVSEFKEDGGESK